MSYIPVVKMKSRIPALLCLVAAVCALLAACSPDTQNTGSTSIAGTPGTGTQPANQLPVVRSGLQISLFAVGTSAYTAPDALEVDSGHIFIDYQNTTAKDCTDQNSSTIVEYTMDGKVIKTFAIPGHSDGMRADPATHLLWVTSCEDGNAKLVTLDPASGTITPYSLPSTPHGGGFDDLFFHNGMTFMVASNPTLDNAGVNVFPALYTVTLASGKATLKSILKGNDSAYDTIAKSAVSLNLVDPDSLTVDASGNLVLVDQGGNDIIVMSNPGTPQQKVSRTPVGSQLDDTVWITAVHGRLLFADGTQNAIYWISAPLGFQPGAIYTQTPDDSGVAGVFGLLDPGTGIVTLEGMGFSKPTGMLFVPGS